MDSDESGEPGWERDRVRAAGARLRALRRERGISRRHAAAAAGVSVSQVARVERGMDARLSTWRTLYNGLGDALELEPRELCEEAGDLLTREKGRRLDRRDAGLERRWS
jgi:transcriptional regulator with XRE-family HTH domain